MNGEWIHWNEERVRINVTMGTNGVNRAMDLSGADGINGAMGLSMGDKVEGERRVVL